MVGCPCWPELMRALHSWADCLVSADGLCMIAACYDSAQCVVERSFWKDCVCQMECMQLLANSRRASCKNCIPIGVLFGLVWLNIDGTGVDRFYSIYQGHPFFQKATYVHSTKKHSFLAGAGAWHYHHQCGHHGILERSPGQHRGYPRQDSVRLRIEVSV